MVGMVTVEQIVSFFPLPLQSLISSSEKNDFNGKTNTLIKKKNPITLIIISI